MLTKSKIAAINVSRFKCILFSLFIKEEI